MYSHLDNEEEEEEQEQEQEGLVFISCSSLSKRKWLTITFPSSLQNRHPSQNVGNCVLSLTFDLFTKESLNKVLLQLTSEYSLNVFNNLLWFTVKSKKKFSEAISGFCTHPYKHPIFTISIYHFLPSSPVLSLYVSYDGRQQKLTQPSAIHQYESQCINFQGEQL